MAKLSGVNVSSIVSINTTNATSISYISGVATSTISGWPGTGTGPILLSEPSWIATGANNPDESAISISATSGSWSMSGTGSYIYKWYVDGTLVNTQYSPSFQAGKPPNPGEWVFSEPTLGTEVTASYLFTSMSLQITASDNNGVASASIDTYINDILYDTYISNTGITGSTEIAALQYLQRKVRAGYYIEKMLDYYPLVGTNETQQKWSMRVQNASLNFSPNWGFSITGSKANGTNTFATSSNVHSSKVGLLMYCGNNVGTENTTDISLFRRSAPFVDNPPLAVTIRNTVDFFQAPTQYGGGALTLTQAPNSNTTIGLHGYICDSHPSGEYWRMVITGSSSNTNYYALISPADSCLTIGARMNGNGSTSFHSSKLYQFVVVENGMYGYIEDGFYTGLNTIVNTFNSMLGR